MNPLMPDVEARFHGLRRLIGNTPLLAVEYTFRGKRRRVFAKSENLNMTGSVKDRMALHVMRRAYETGAIRPGALIVEATSGNTGISFAAVGRALGHPVAIFMPDWMSSERVNLLRSFGAKIHPVSKENGGFLGSIQRAEELAASSDNAFLPRQFANEDNCAAHEASTGPEIHWQLGGHGLRPDAFVAGVGTGGTVMGVGRYLRAHHPDVSIHPLEPSNSPTLSTGHKVGRHRIQGISDEFIPPIVDLDELDDILAVDDGDAILMAQKLARELGLGVGISSGANFLGAVLLQERLDAEAVVVTIFCDSNKKYLSTDLLSEEPVTESHLSQEVRLESFTAFNRVCQMCDTSSDLVRMAGGMGA
ncbi:MAG TPA: cysteine synthase family protein [Longimicrobiales bacterium]|nr:cysteine synthase family protein [Longimicrobiales bacterium]